MGSTKKYYVNTQAPLREGGRKIQKMSIHEFAEKARKLILTNCDSNWVREKIEKSNSDDKIINYLPWAIRELYHNKNSTIRKDFKGISPDWENYDMFGKVRTVKGAPYITMRVGGDWECPICVMVYHDGKQFRCYVPEKGNAYRKDIKRLFGNIDGEYDVETRTYSDEYNSEEFRKVIPSDDKYAFDQLCKDGFLDKDKDFDKKKGISNHIWFDTDMCIEDFSARVELNESNSYLYDRLLESISDGIINALNEKRKVSHRKQQYLENKAASVGTEIECPICGTHFIKKQYSQAFCSTECKNAFWNAKGDRHRAGYMHDYNKKHPERLEYIGIYQGDDGKLGHFDDEGNFWTFEEEQIMRDSCEDPIEGR